MFLVVFLGARWALHPGHAEPSVADQPQIEVPTPAPDPRTLMPHATEASPGIANIEEMAKPWSSKQFFIRNELSGENIPAMLIRLPTGSLHPRPAATGRFLSVHRRETPGSSTSPTWPN